MKPQVLLVVVVVLAVLVWAGNVGEEYLWMAGGDNGRRA